jgi:uncharacterized protein
MSDRLELFLKRAEALLSRLEGLIPPAVAAPAWESAVAFRWRGLGQAPRIRPVHRLSPVRLDDLQCLDRQKILVERNTRQFLQGLPANNVLLWGSRGTGKSTLIRALLNRYSSRGLRLIEVDREGLKELPEILECIEDRPERFILYCDDLSFEADDVSYKTLKAVLEGALTALSGNALIYATSNRRHLLPEYQWENQEARHLPGDRLQCEIHHGDTVEEKISLSERFGLWVSFHPFNQEEYLAVVRHWLAALNALPEDFQAAREEALRFALGRGSRSGRVAWQFAKDWAGRKLLEGGENPELSAE